jgi:hypothetical protein
MSEFEHVMHVICALAAPLLGALCGVYAISARHLSEQRRLTRSEQITHHNFLAAAWLTGLLAAIFTVYGLIWS